MSSGVKRWRREALEILDALESELVYTPGARDKQARPILVVAVPAGELAPGTKSNLDVLLDYYLAIFSEETKSKGLTVLVDARSATWRSARSCIRRTSDRLLEEDHSSVRLIALRPDGFWDKQRVDCTRAAQGDAAEPIYVPLSRLSAYVDLNQLTYNLGGSKFYDHAGWIQNRMRVDEFTSDAENLLAKMEEQKQRLVSGEVIRRDPDESLESSREMNIEMASVAQRILHSGRYLASSMSRETAQDVLDTVHKIHKLIDSIEQKQVEIEKAWTDMDRNIDILKEIEFLEEGVSCVTNWILGPADSMLNSHYQIGFDVASSEELRREHEKLELECRDTYGKYAELTHKIDALPTEYLSEDLKSQKDFMDFVCRSFATRLERRRNVLITSQRFFRLVSEYFDRTSEVFDKLIMGSRTCNFSSAGSKLLKLERSQQKLERLERELVKEGEKLSDVLSMPVKDALCRDVQIDYGEDIINIQDILDATNARKNIFNDSVELQKLTLKQFALVFNYESDAEQALEWLNDLFDVLVSNHVEIGCNVAEIQAQKQEHQSFQETARGTYEYGCQLLTGARALRVSCKLDPTDNTILVSQLRQIWRQLRSVGQEHLTRLRVCAVFHRNVTDHCVKLREMIDTVSSFSPKRSRSVTPSSTAGSSEATPEPEQCRAEIREVLVKREKLLPEVGRMVRLGRLLRSRLREPLVHQSRTPDLEESRDESGNQSAVQSISVKLLEVTRLAEKLDAKLCEAGAKSQGGLKDSGENIAGDNVRDASVGTCEKEINEKADKTEEQASQTNESELLTMVTGDGQLATTTISPRIMVISDTSDQYATATECSSVPRSRSESFLSSEYEDALVSPTYRRLDDLPIKRNGFIPLKKLDVSESTSTETVQDVVDYSSEIMDSIQRTFTEQETSNSHLRVPHEAYVEIPSYNLAELSDSVNCSDIQTLSHSVTEEDAPSPPPPPTPPPLPPLKTFYEEHTYTTPSGQVINYSKATAKGMNGHHNNSSSLLTRVEEDFLRMVQTVSEEMESSIQRHHHRHQQQNASSISGPCTSVEEFNIMPAPIAICEFN